MNKKTVLLVEDEERMRQGLVFNLETEGYQVLEAADGEKGIELAIAEQPHVMILDVMLPGQDGFAVARHLRENDYVGGILMLTARADEVDKIRGFKEGADDYVTKPFSVAEVLARVDAMIRRTERILGTTETEVLELGDTRIDLPGMRVQKKDEEEHLSNTEVDLIRYLLKQQGQAVSRQDILHDLWGLSRYTLSRTVDNHIARIRRKIEDDPANPKYLVTVHGKGYRLLKP